MAKFNETTNDANSHRPLSLTLCTFVVCLALAVRVMVGYQAHSGQDNYHGSKTAYGGDYEAQRHWMELTWHLPIGDWYWYDLQYWGLDYPPLTAYVSYICGAMSEWLVGPETVALETSRGYENDPTHKAYMRATVWVLEALVYFPAVYCILKTLWQSKRSTTNQAQSNISLEYEFASAFELALLQPAILLVDHGHFQYNTVALGLTLWSLYFISHPKFYWNCVTGSIFFCLALNFKQMTLYYAPVIFAYLLGRCFTTISNGSNNNSASNINSEQRNNQTNFLFIFRFLALGITVIVSFAILWWPFLVNGPSTEEDVDGMSWLSQIVARGKHVLHRIFPLERGLFEGKVSNLWCALDTKPINIRDRMPADMQPLAALVVTFLLMLPSCVRLFLVGQGARQASSQNSHASDLLVLLWGTTSSALAFFLASFQVHEKSILLALAPASLLLWDDTLFCDWFAFAAAWSMWPLLVVDRLQVAYYCSMMIFYAGINRFRPTMNQEDELGKWPSVEWCWRVLCKLSFVAMMSLHAMKMVITVPSQLPDLFPVLWSVGGCALCCLAWARTIAALLLGKRAQNGSSKMKHD